MDAMKVTLAVFSVMLVALMQNDYAATAMQVFSAFWALSGIQMVFAPQSAMKTWKNEMTLKPVPAFLMRMLAFRCYPFLRSMLFLDASSVQAYGYFSTIWAICHGYFLVDGTYKKLNIPLDVSTPARCGHDVASNFVKIINISAKAICHVKNQRIGFINIPPCYLVPIEYSVCDLGCDMVVLKCWVPP
jgi:hypothetical protein